MGLPGMQLKKTHLRNMAGMSLIELMIAIVIGLIVLGGLTSIVVATMRTNTDNMRMTRLTQEMRGAMQLVTSDLRRSGFSQNALQDIGAGATANPFIAVDYIDGDADGIDDDDCILYSFDSDIGGASSIDGTQETAEQHGVRYNADELTVEYKDGSGSGCDLDADWEPMTDPELVEVTALTFGDVDGDGAFPCVEITGGSAVILREIQITMTGRLADDAEVQRTLQDTVRVRNDEVNIGACP